MCPYMRKGVRQTHREGGEGGAEGDAVASQGMPIASRTWKSQGTDPPIEPPVGVQPYGHLAFGLLASRTVRE